VEALEKIRLDNYDIVLSDLKMELMDGMELLETIKRDFPHLEVIMMTGFATVENAIEALKIGAYDFLLKPIKLDQIRLVVKKCVDKIQMSEEVQRLREINERLRELQIMKDRFIAITSHELRTPVTHLKSYMGFLTEEGFSEEDRKMFIEIINASIEDLERIVTDMHQIIQIDQKSLPLVLESFDLNTLIEQVVKQMQIEIRERDLTLTTDLAATLPQLIADRQQIRRILIELITNAIRFTPDGGKIIVSSFLKEQFAVVTVTDTGIGIPEKELGRIFEKFYEVQDSDHHTSSRINFLGGGIGLGLWLAKGIIETHQGRLKIESKEGKGTKVSIFLPLKGPE